MYFITFLKVVKGKFNFVIDSAGPCGQEQSQFCFNAVPPDNSAAFLWL